MATEAPTPTTPPKSRAAKRYPPGTDKGPQGADKKSSGYGGAGPALDPRATDFKDMGDRHVREFGDMVKRHTDEHMAIMSKHGGLSATGADAAHSKAAATAGSPKKLGKTENKGTDP